MVLMNANLSQKLEMMGNSFLRGHFIFSKEYDDNSLRRQFAAPSSGAHNMSFKFTKDAGLINAYYQVRDAVYKEISGMKDYSFLEDEYDKNSEILVAMNGNNCIGGARLTISNEYSNVKLPIENEGFLMGDLLNSLGIYGVNYCEMSRVAVMPEFRNGSVFEQITTKMHDLCLERNVPIGFACNTAELARRFKIFWQKMGYNLIVRSDIEVPYHASHGKNKLILSMIDFTPDRRYHNLLTVANMVSEQHNHEVLVPEFA